MRKSRLTLAAACCGALAAGVVAAAFVVPGVALAGTTSCGGQQCFAVKVSPVSAAAGGSRSFTFDITNESSIDPLNAVTIAAPPSWKITGVSRHGRFSARYATFGAPGSNPKRLALAPKHSMKLRVTAIAPCAAGSYTWGIRATNDGDNNADDFKLNPASAAHLSGSVKGSCSLAFVTQPAGTPVGARITSRFDSKGGPVKVEVLSASGRIVTDSTAAVTLRIESNPAAGTLSGTTAATARKGVASFSRLSINKAGIGYTLEATSRKIKPATSADFTIWGSLEECSSSACSGSASSTTTTGSVSTSSSSAADDQFLAIGIGGVDYNCGSSYQLTSDPVSFDLFSSDGVAQTGTLFDAELEISASAVDTSGHPAPWTWQICYASIEPFTARQGTAGTVKLGGVTYYTGLLPRCSWMQQAPCVLWRHKDRAGNVFVKFLATGDPVYRG